MVSLAGEEFLSWEVITAFVDNDSSALTADSEAEFKGIKIDFGAVPMKDNARRNLQPLFDLGYEQINASMDMAVFADLREGLLDINKLTIDLQDAGSIAMSIKSNGYTESFVREFGKITSSLRKAVNSTEMQAQSMQMMAALTMLSLIDVSLEVSDASLLKKIINLQAERLNQDPDQISAMVAPMSSIMLAPFNVPQFAATLSTALSVFMQGNKTIRATIEPEGGIILTEIIALTSGVRAGSVQPQAVIDRLNLKVSAE
ncbi:MAG: hypothetical protein AAF412_14220 [Pseudomonadota bacterium]